MKRTIFKVWTAIVVCAILCAVGCSNLSKDDPYVYDTRQIDVDNLRTVTYDMCEYIVVPTKYNSAYTLVHKGNCKNHKR